MKFSGTPVDYPRAAPLLSEHTDEVLREWLGMSAAAAGKLRDEGVI